MMATVNRKTIISRFIKGALSGCTKETMVKDYKKAYNLTDNEIEWLIEACNFNEAPKNINYENFYNLPLIKNAHCVTNHPAQLYYIDNFLTQLDCKLLRGIIDINGTRSTERETENTDKRVYKNTRTSTTAYLHYQDHNFFLEIDRKLTGAMQLHPASAEIMHGQKYEIDGYFREHNDYFSEEELKIFGVWMGQRTWTNILYLNDVEEGGETYFPRLDLKVKPKQGRLVFWNNLNKDGTQNINTRHEGLKPISGAKYIVTKWWRSWNII